ncbi:hypothetical protein, partial [Zhengella mangrovi]|uniref:hypothetical protein n=1 Tax=Zhengella mangrovi TaxID=1982044 RepID=UPI00197C3310
DGLLAFIGIVPDAQGRRFSAADGSTLEPACEGVSLARHLFEAWMDAAVSHECPRLYIRTRRRIMSIRYLSEDLGFELCGEFTVEFRGECQTRLVYRRAERRRTMS